MFRFLLRPNLLKRPYSPRARLTCPGPLARTTLATLALSFGALALHADQIQADSEQHSQSDPDQPPLNELLRAYLVFSLCSFPSLVDASPRILSFLSTVPVLKDLSEAFLRVTFFNQFVGGETIDACIPLLHKLRKSNQGVLIAYSVEQPNVSSPESSLDSSQRALESILHSIDCAADFEEGLSTSSYANHNNTKTTGTWVSFKLSTLLPGSNALWVLSDWIVRQGPQSQIPFPGAPDAGYLQRFLQPDDHVDTNIAQHVQSLQTLHTTLRKICTRAQTRGVRLMIDAEETWFQPAIDLFSVLLMQEFNSLRGRSSSGVTASQPLVYTTLQAYLVRTPAFLDFLINHAKDNDYSLGVKLVRGAYIDAEVAAHASKLKSEVVDKKSVGSMSISPNENPPTHPNKELTDATYDNCVRVLVAEVAKDVDRARIQLQNSTEFEEKNTTSTPRIAVLFGTHNWKSSRLVLDEISKTGLGEIVNSTPAKERGDDDPDMAGTGRRKVEKIILSEEVRQRICIAQLYGMSDSLAAYLVDRTNQSTKWNKSLTPFVIRCIPYGPLRDVMPYLARRAVENRSVLGSSGSASVSRLGSDNKPTAIGLVGNDSGEVGGEDEREAGQGRAVEERKRLGRMIWERVKFWKF